MCTLSVSGGVPATWRGLPTPCYPNGEEKEWPGGGSQHRPAPRAWRTRGESVGLMGLGGWDRGYPVARKSCGCGGVAVRWTARRGAAPSDGGADPWSERLIGERGEWRRVRSCAVRALWGEMLLLRVNNCVLFLLPNRPSFLTEMDYLWKHGYGQTWRLRGDFRSCNHGSKMIWTNGIVPPQPVKVFRNKVPVSLVLLGKKKMVYIRFYTGGSRRNQLVAQFFRKHAEFNQPNQYTSARKSSVRELVRKSSITGLQNLNTCLRREKMMIREKHGTKHKKPSTD
jgi:hypothetical protein